MESNPVMCDFSILHLKLNANSSKLRWANQAAGKCPHLNLSENAGHGSLG